jgi:dihydrofolate synthase / folylpolyglutamate synthase
VPLRPVHFTMNYTEALAYLNGTVNFERAVPGRAMRAAITLDRVRELAQRLGNPQNTFKSLHVAGTKGKGSTCAFAESILRAAGLKTGMYVSPHLQDVRERITVCGKMIPEAEFARMLTQCEPALEEMRSPPEGERRPTYFEILTHLAFSWFADQKVDVAIVEVGLGGRLDATNIINPAACAITNISFDHQAILGDTLEQIASEKAGIIKPGVPVVVAPQTPEASNAIERRAKECGVRCEVAGRDFLFSEAQSERQFFPAGNVRFKDGLNYSAELGLRGRYQIENWAVAVRLCDVFWSAHHGKHVTADAVTRGSANVNWPGRLEKISLPDAGNSPEVFLDGAHNDYSLKTVLNELRSTYGDKRIVLLFACAKDKNSEAMLRVAKEAGVADVIFTHSGNTRGKEPSDLAREWKQVSGGGEAEAYPVCADGLEAARKRCGGDGALLITGSLYLVGAIKDMMSAAGVRSAS